MKTINNQQDVKLGKFTQKVDKVLTKIKKGKAASLNEIRPEVWKVRKFNDVLLRYCNVVYNQNTINWWTKGCILPFPKKDDLRIAKNYQGITLTSIAALLLNHFKPKIEKILRKNQNDFQRNRSIISTEF